MTFLTNSSFFKASIASPRFSGILPIPSVSSSSRSSFFFAADIYGAYSVLFKKPSTPAPRHTASARYGLAVASGKHNSRHITPSASFTTFTAASSLSKDHPLYTGTLKSPDSLLYELTKGFVIADMAGRWSIIPDKKHIPKSLRPFSLLLSSNLLPAP